MLGYCHVIKSHSQKNPPITACGDKTFECFHIGLVKNTTATRFYPSLTNSYKVLPLPHKQLQGFTSPKLQRFLFVFTPRVLVTSSCCSNGKDTRVIGPTFPLDIMVQYFNCSDLCWNKLAIIFFILLQGVSCVNCHCTFMIVSEWFRGNLNAAIQWLLLKFNIWTNFLVVVSMPFWLL